MLFYCKINKESKLMIFRNNDFINILIEVQNKENKINQFLKINYYSNVKFLEIKIN
jgi:hypothetical protein